MIEKTSIDILVSDIEYLKYEAQSLNQVIDSVPYIDKPLDGASIVEIFLSIDSLQVKIIDVLNSLQTKGSNINIDESELYQRIELESSELEEISFAQITKDIEKNRTHLISKIEDQNSVFFEVEINSDNENISIFELLSSMVEKERVLLKEVANLVLTFQTDMQFQRKIAQQKLNMS